MPSTILKAKGKSPLPGISSELPDKFAPQLATLVTTVPQHSEDWLLELKFDGYRLLTRVEGVSIKLFTRSGNDWTAKLKPLHDRILKQTLPDGWYDGEIIATNPKGLPDFGLLQRSFHNKKTSDIVYYIFDCPFLQGQDLREVPLIERRTILQSVLSRVEDEHIKFSGQLDASPKEMLAHACQMGLEGLIGKRKQSVYVSRRSADWIKLKCTRRQEMVIGGFTEPKGSRAGIGALLLGVYDNEGNLNYAGSVGTGFDDKTLKSLFTSLSLIRTRQMPFTKNLGSISKHANWVEPRLVAEVSFAEWTIDNHLRHSVFHGLRTDKNPESIVREIPTAIDAAKPAAAKKTASKAEKKL